LRSRKHLLREILYQMWLVAIFHQNPIEHLQIFQIYLYDTQLKEYTSNLLSSCTEVLNRAISPLLLITVIRREDIIFREATNYLLESRT